MKNSVEDILKALPDFDELTKLTKEISSLMFTRLSLDAEIKSKESDVFFKATTDEKYFQGGKPPSSTYIDNTYKYPGFNGEILPLRIEMAKVTADLEGKKLLYDVYKTMIEVWRTMSSNQRSASL
jgi:hypothetical protein